MTTLIGVAGLVLTGLSILVGWATWARRKLTLGYGLVDLSDGVGSELATAFGHVDRDTVLIESAITLRSFHDLVSDNTAAVTLRLSDAEWLGEIKANHIDRYTVISVERLDVTTLTLRTDRWRSMDTVRLIAAARRTGDDPALEMRAEIANLTVGTVRYDACYDTKQVGPETAATPPWRSAIAALPNTLLVLLGAGYAAWAINADRRGVTSRQQWQEVADWWAVSGSETLLTLAIVSVGVAAAAIRALWRGEAGDYRNVPRGVGRWFAQWRLITALFDAPLCSTIRTLRSRPLPLPPPAVPPSVESITRGTTLEQVLQDLVLDAQTSAKPAHP